MGACCSGCLPGGLVAPKQSPIRDPDTHVVKLGGGNKPTTTFVLPLRLKAEKLIGSGAYGCVASCKDTLTGETIAIKKVADFAADLIDGKRIFREVKLMRLLSNEHILSISDILPPPSPDFDDVYIVLPMMEMDLHQVIYGKAKLRDEHFQAFVYQILLGIAYLHSAAVAHRDLKPANILTNRQCEVKICDFGLSRVMGEGAPAEGGPEFQEAEAVADLTDYVVTRWYRAPEVILMETKYTLAIDVWSVGCILAEMVNGKTLFPGQSSGHQLKKVVDALGTPSEDDIHWLPAKTQGRTFLTKHCANKPRQSWDKLVPKATEEARLVLNELLAFNFEKRASATAALQLAYFDSVRDTEDLVKADRGCAINNSFDHFKLTKRALQNLIYHECGSFHPEIYSRDSDHLAKAGITAPPGMNQA